MLKFCFCLFLGYLEFSTESHKNNTLLQNEKKNESFLILYRKIMIPVATFISCVFAFIIVRELRLYYFVWKTTATNELKEKKYTNGVYIVWRNTDQNDIHVGLLCRLPTAWLFLLFEPSPNIKQDIFLSKSGSIFFLKKDKF